MKISLFILYTMLINDAVYAFDTYKLVIFKKFIRNYLHINDYHSHPTHLLEL